MNDPMNELSSPVLLEHLFRRQAGRTVSCLAGLLGFEHLQLAEDAVQEAMLRAVQTWSFQGVPEKPEAWLFRVAHNHAISVLRRGTRFESKTGELIDLGQRSMVIRNVGTGVRLKALENWNDFSGQAVLVTGGTKGIGLVTM